VIELGADGIDRRAYARIVHDRERLEIADETLAAVDAARARMLAHVEAGSPAYGVTTGLGHFAGVELGAAEQDALQRSLLTARAAGLGPPLPAEVVRGAMLLRLTGFLSRTVGVSADACRFLRARIDEDWSPVVPQGPYGAAGEIGPLAHLFQTFVGEGLVEVEGERITAAEALRRSGVEPFRPKPREGLAFIGGSPLATALAIRLTDRFRDLLEAATTAAALGLALTGMSARALSTEVAAIGGDEDERRVCRRIAELCEHQPVWEGTVQPPVSTRILPQVHGAALGAIEAVDAVVAGRLRAVSDSPLFLEEADGVEGIFPSGGFHALRVTLGLEALGIAVAHVVNLVEKRLHRLLDGRYSGLPDQLTSSPGVQAGVVVLHKSVVGLAASARLLAAPASVNAMDTSTGQEDVQSFTFLVAERLDRALDDLEAAIACELVALRQAAALRTDPLVSSELSVTLAALASAVPPFDADRSASGDIQRVRALVRDGRFGSPSAGSGSQACRDGEGES